MKPLMSDPQLPGSEAAYQNPIIEILLVEDDENDVDLTLYALKKFNLGNRIQVIRDGAEAVDFIFARGRYVERSEMLRPKLILLDLKLPKLSGVEVLERLKADPHTKNIPVVIMTSSQEAPDLQRCYALGANSYIVKPVDFEQFAKAVQQVGLYWYVLNQPWHDPVENESQNASAHLPAQLPTHLETP